MDSICLADNLSIPAEALTQTFAILAKRGVGKTYTALVLAEEMFPIGQIVVVDPVGVCWGLRSSACGQNPGLPILVLGGDHGDVDLEHSSGEAIAEFVVESGQSVVIDLATFSGKEANQFMTAFAETLYHRKAKDRRPLHLILDEADSFIPQKPLPGEQRMLGAWDKIVRRGRARGLGVTLVTQRPAVVHKNVLTQIEVLIALRTVSPQDRKAIESWVEVHGTPQERNTLLASLPSLPVGTAWVWSPGWLNLFQQVQIRQRRTFDSSVTPKVGSVPLIPRTLAAVDLTELQGRITASVQIKKGNDSTQIAGLRRQVAELEQKLQTSESFRAGGSSRACPGADSLSPELASVHPMPVERIEVPVFQSGEIERLEGAIASLQDLGYHLIQVAKDITALLPSVMQPPVTPTPEIPRRKRAEVKNRDTKALSEFISEEAQLRAGERRMLETLARHYPMTVTRTQLGSLSNFKATGGTFGNYLSTLKREGLIIEVDKELQITQRGFDHLGMEPFKPQTPAEHLEIWRSVLRLGERRMLDTLVANYPRSLSRQELGKLTNYEASGGTFGNYLSTLRRNQLIEVKGGSLRASKILVGGD